MIVTAKDLRFNISMLFDVLNKGEDITVTYRGKPKAKLVSYKNEDLCKKDSLIFGMHKDMAIDVDKQIREMRKGRKFDI